MNVPIFLATKGARYINWSSYIRLIIVKLATMYNFFLGLYTDSSIIERITKISSFNLKEFLEKFADIIDKEGLIIIYYGLKLEIIMKLVIILK